MSEAPSLHGEEEVLDDWAELARNALAVAEERVTLDESRTRATTLNVLTRPASVIEFRAARPLTMGPMVRSTPTSSSESGTVSSARHGRGYSVPHVNSMAGHVVVLPSNGLDNSYQPSVPVAPSSSGLNNLSVPINRSDNGRPASDNNVSSGIAVIPPPRPLPFPPTINNTLPRTATQLVDANGNLHSPQITTVPYNAVGNALHPTVVHPPSIANSLTSVAPTETPPNDAIPKRWRGGEIIGRTQPHLVYLQPGGSGSDAAASKEPVAGPSGSSSGKQPGGSHSDAAASKEPVAGPSGSSSGKHPTEPWRHWTDSETNPPIGQDDGSRVLPPQPVRSDDPRARYSAPPSRSTGPRPSARGRSRNSAPPPSRSSGARIQANSTTDDNSPSVRYSAPPPRSVPHSSPRRTRSTRRNPRPTVPTFRGEAALLEPLPQLRYPRLSRGLVKVVRASFPPLPPTPSVDTFRDAFQRLIAKYGTLIPHRPKSRMEALNLIFAAATDMPEEEGVAVAAMVMEAFGAIKAEQRLSVGSLSSTSSDNRRLSSERESLEFTNERQGESNDESARFEEPTTDPYTLLLEEFSHLLPPGASGSRDEVLEALLGAAVELPDGQREPAVQAIMEVYDAVTYSVGGANAQGKADPYDLLVLQYGHLVPESSRGNRVETLDALLLAATELSDGEGAIVAQLVLEAHDAGPSGTQRGSSDQRSSVDTRGSTRNGSLAEDPFQRLMAEYGHLLPHRPDTRMATLDLMFVAASALPEAEGELVAVLISEAWEALNAALPVLDQDAAEAVEVAAAADESQEEAGRESDGEDGDDEGEDDPPSRWSNDSSERGPCPCCGPCGSVCEYEAVIGPQPLPRAIKRRSFRRQRCEGAPSPQVQPEAGPSRPRRRTGIRAASRDLRFWDRGKGKFKPGPSGSEGIDMLYALLEREAVKAEALGDAKGKGKAREVPRVSFADSRRQPEEEEEQREEDLLRLRRMSLSSGSWDEAELAASGLTELEPEPEVHERRRWFKRRQ
ncbi:hypothetical protein CspHIS471_0504120 [Cutaneotrichosporon sp. HIS471]|nr:hypothetical protein CspHIS471_0504120 [Cutaneotrichosporon sp. HIS471]